MGDRAGPQLQQARGRHHVHRAGRGWQGGCPTCHVSPLVSRVTCHVYQNTSPGECAVRMARAGARIVGVNCLFDPFLCLDTLRQMKEGLEAAGHHHHVL